MSGAFGAQLTAVGAFAAHLTAVGAFNEQLKRDYNYKMDCRTLMVCVLYTFTITR